MGESMGATMADHGFALRLRPTPAAVGTIAAVGWTVDAVGVAGAGVGVASTSLGSAVSWPEACWTLLVAGVP
mgnify:CR=1 FL=1